MQRVTITIDDDLAETLDRYMESAGHANRSETIRDLVRMGLEQRASGATSRGPCLGALVYVYDHETRRLAERLTSEQHDHHDLTVATLHVHLDARKCLEVAVLRGPGQELRAFADRLVGERGVQYGQLATIPLEGSGQTKHTHTHVRD